MIENSDASIFEKNIPPLMQAGIVLVTALVFMLCWKAAVHFGVDLRQRTPWLISSALMLFFGLFNSVFSLSAKKRFVYWRDSIYAYALLGVLGGLMAWGFSGLTIDEAGSFKWMYFIFTFSFIIFLTIINLMRKIVELAQKQDRRLRGEE
jgi:hypothetical protein